MSIFVCYFTTKYPFLFLSFLFDNVGRSGKLTLGALESTVLARFRSLNHTPIWKNERPESIRGNDELRIYRIYPIGITQRQALYTFKFNDVADLERYIKSNPCAKFEVIFV